MYGYGYFFLCFFNMFEVLIVIIVVKFLCFLIIDFFYWVFIDKVKI